MAVNERVPTGWSQPRRSTFSKSHDGCLGSPGTSNLDDLGDLMNLLSSCNKSKIRKESWPLCSGTAARNFSSRNCCLKNGRIHCSCLWAKNCLADDGHSSCGRGFRKFPSGNDPIRLQERKMPFWNEKRISGHNRIIKTPEEYVIDDNELSFDFYDMPFDIPKRHQVRKVGKVKTVSIIDTLSELASGATDREDEGGFSSAASESAILGQEFYRTRMRNARHAPNRKGHGIKENYFNSRSGSDGFYSEVIQQSKLRDNLSSFHGSVCSSQIRDLHEENGNFNCSSLKRTLKCLRKAVSSNVAEEKTCPRRYPRRHDERDAFRQCFSDSEVHEVPKPWNPAKCERPELSSHSKSKSLLTVTAERTPGILPQKYVIEKPVLGNHARQKVDTPDWIRQVFQAAKTGDIDNLKNGLKDVDPALVRNLSDDHGNNLWHISASQNHIHCLDWLCFRAHQQADALKDENKHGFTPVALAVKHGSLFAVQWLIHNTISKSQLIPTRDSRSLLHIAAKYGQETSVQWLVNYMNTQNINVNGLDSEGNSALHLAAKHGHINCVKALIFQNGDMKLRNERGLKPINLAVKYSQMNCADYLLAMESCFSLAAVNLKQQSEVQHLCKENAEVKSYFKELLLLTRRIQQRQRELMQTDESEQFDVGIGDRSVVKHAKYVDDYSQILAAVISDEERRLHVVEDKWKKLRKKPKLTDSKKVPLDIVRLHFARLLDKVSEQSQAGLSTSETSDDCLQSGEEDILFFHPGRSEVNPFISTPDVIHTFANQNVPFMDTINRLPINDRSTVVSKHTDSPDNLQCAMSVLKTQFSSSLKTPVVKPAGGTSRDVNLKVFFNQNPNLRQTSETCSVLEVLDPSSSDSDECSNNEIHVPKNQNTEDEMGQSSSSSATETLSPSSCGPSSSGSKKSGSRSSSNGSRHDNRTGDARINISHLNSAQCSSPVAGNVENKRTDSRNNNGNSDVQSKDSSHISNCENLSAEPDLIKGTQKKMFSVQNVLLDRDKHHDVQHIDNNFAKNPNVSAEDNESLEADRSFCSAIDLPESILSHQVLSDSSVAGTGVKKKNFLLKFALKGRWPSKPRARSLKNEISAEEFRETYSRSSENALAPSHCSSVGISVAKKFSGVLAKDSEKTHEAVSVTDNATDIVSNVVDSSVVCLAINSLPQYLPNGLLPPRRDPPPVPPRPVWSKDACQIHPIDDIHVNITNSSVSHVAGSVASLHEPFMSSNSSNMWQSPDPKSMFRPASSASRVESPSRAEDSFLLNKSSSASTEVLSALGSSTTGRQSPAPSEVSKTESALSPPSDVSKTESTRHLTQLSKIEETAHLIKCSVVQKKEDKTADNHVLKEERNEAKPKRKSGNCRKHNADKPWYEFSDEEDTILPQRYEVISERMRGSSEGEEIVTG